MMSLTWLISCYNQAAAALPAAVGYSSAAPLAVLLNSQSNQPWCVASNHHALRYAYCQQH
jgi:hypothetical protein